MAKFCTHSVEFFHESLNRVANGSLPDPSRLLLLCAAHGRGNETAKPRNLASSDPLRLTPTEGLPSEDCNG